MLSHGCPRLSARTIAAQKQHVIHHNPMKTVISLIAERPFKPFVPMMRKTGLAGQKGHP
jgi:hypothetical protein